MIDIDVDHRQTTDTTAVIDTSNNDDNDDVGNDKHLNQTTTITNTTDEKLIDVNNMEKTIMMDMSDVDKDHHQTTDTTTISVISVTDEKEKVNDSSNKEKLTTTNVDIADSGNDDDVEHHQTATTNSTTITTTIDERKNVLDINNEEKTVLSKLRCNSGSDDDYHQIISTDEKEKVNDTTEEELTTTTRINVSEGLLTQKNNNVKNRETMIACTGFTDEMEEKNLDDISQKVMKKVNDTREVNTILSFCEENDADINFPIICNDIMKCSESSNEVTSTVNDLKGKLSSLL